MTTGGDFCSVELNQLTFICRSCFRQGKHNYYFLIYNNFLIKFTIMKKFILGGLIPFGFAVVLVCGYSIMFISAALPQKIKTKQNEQRNCNYHVSKYGVTNKSGRDSTRNRVLLLRKQKHRSGDTIAKRHND